MPTVEIRKARIHFDFHGEGRPLVLTTGQGTGPEERAELIAGLARHFRVLTYDQRGTGRSEPATQGDPIEVLAGDLAALMDRVGLGMARVLGHSTGTGLATCLAATHPERVARLVLAAPWTHADRELRAVQALRKVAARCLPPDRYAQFNSMLLYPPEYRRIQADRLDRTACQASPTTLDPDGIAARLDAILAFDARGLYTRIECPTLVMGASDDLLMPSWHANAAAAAIRRAELDVTAYGGHMFPVTNTESFLCRVLPFLH